MCENRIFGVKSVQIIRSRVQYFIKLRNKLISNLWGTVNRRFKIRSKLRAEAVTALDQTKKQDYRKDLTVCADAVSSKDNCENECDSTIVFSKAWLIPARSA